MDVQLETVLQTGRGLMVTQGKEKETKRKGKEQALFFVDFLKYIFLGGTKLLVSLVT